MKAITYASYGPPEVLTLRDVPTPTPKPNELLIRVRAAEATKSDCELRSFEYAVKWFWLPLRLAMGVRRPRVKILGGYFAGEVAEMGGEVRDFQVGDEIFGCAGMRFGAYAEYMVVPANSTIVQKPNNMSFAEAAAVPLGGLNALHFMRKANVQPGERVLVNGAGASIGTHGVQIAKAMGAEVTGVDHSRKEAAIRRLGATHFIDYTSEDFTQSEQRYDLIFDMVPGSPYSAIVNCLTPNGRYLSGNPQLSTMLRTVFTTRFTSKSAGFAFAKETREELNALREMIEAGEIQSIVDETYPLAEAATAHHRVENEERNGAIVLVM